MSGSSSYVVGSKRACAFLKAVRAQPMTREQLAHDLGWSKRAVHYWVTDLLAEGLVVEMDPPPTDEPIHGFPPKLISLAPAWRGVSK